MAHHRRQLDRLGPRAEDEEDLIKARFMEK